MTSILKTSALVIAASVVLAVPVLAEGYTNGSLPSGGFTLGVTGLTSGLVNGTGTPMTVLSGNKDAWNESSFSLEGLNCPNCGELEAVASVDVGEAAQLTASTHGDESGEAVGSAGVIQLNALGMIMGGDGGFGFQAGFGATGEAVGAGVGDNVVVNTGQYLGGVAEGDLTYVGSPCNFGSPCDPQNPGQATLRTSVGGISSNFANVQAGGMGAIAISNVTSSMLTGLLAPASVPAAD